MTACTVCEHPRRVHAERAIGGGHRSILSIAKECEMSYPALKRHIRQGHISGRAVEGGSSPSTNDAIDPNASPVELMRAIVARLSTVDVTRLSANAQTSHLDAYRRAVETLAKLEPPPASSVARIHEIEGLGTFMAVLFRHLEPHPDIRFALVAELQRTGWTTTTEGV